MSSFCAQIPCLIVPYVWEEVRVGKRLHLVLRVYNPIEEEFPLESKNGTYTEGRISLYMHFVTIHVQNLGSFISKFLGKNVDVHHCHVTLFNLLCRKFFLVMLMSH